MFGPDGDEPLDPAASEARLQRGRGHVERAIGRRMDLAEIAEGFLAIAVDNMANAIRKISIARGHDVTRYALACFGGAGGQHACRVADALGIERILVHPLASLLSAYGIGLADVKAIREAGWLKPLERGLSRTRLRRSKSCDRCAGRAGRSGRPHRFADAPASGCAAAIRRWRSSSPTIMRCERTSPTCIGGASAMSTRAGRSSSMR